ncbi:S-adenosyl-L-methionine-dependent methyltransferase [Podospora australis]|uniref:S-adenosyl-L-methionine-dependent methyltransferase n=1 Tax=Podospora australis TaxID=1536484 RepID=A0AAN6WYX6_9PEZI|nr:S-adenosyl-L-methionine-dependent methyltransferase [Podospora australis]
MASRLRIPARVPPSQALFSSHLTTTSRRSLTISSPLLKKKFQHPQKRPQSKPQPQPSRPPPPPPPRTSPSGPSSGSSSEADTLANLSKIYRWPLVGAGVIVLMTSFYISSVITSLYLNDKSSPSSSPCSSHSHIPSGRPANLTRESAISFDCGLDLPERLSRIKSMRKELSSRARGHVLEVACGTGRNLPYYNWTEVVSPLSSFSSEEQAQKSISRNAKLLDLKASRLYSIFSSSKKKQTDEGLDEKVIGSMEGEVLSYTGVDISGDMLSVARDRVRENVPSLTKIMRKKRAEPMPAFASPTTPETVVEALDGRVRLVLADAEQTLPPPVEGKRYDTILQTFGLCSVADPKKLLRNMAENLKPDTGKILLLEHGKGGYGWIDRQLDEWAPEHFQQFGCWWNRDIEGIIEETKKEVKGLEVVGVERPWLHGGTTYIVELRVRSQQAQK